MSNFIFRLVRTLRRTTFSILACTAVAAMSADAQTAEIPRTQDGRPDMNGIWQALGNAHWDIEPHAARAALQMQPGPVVPVPAKPVLAFGAVGSVPSGVGVVVGGEIPYLPEARAKKIENQENWSERDPEIKCYLPGVPRATYMPFPFQIFQSSSHFFIAYEYAGALRNIYMEDPGPAQVDSWMGQSWGQWKGDSFEVETKGFNGQTWLDRSGNFHSDQLKVTEKYTLMNNHTMQYEATIEDPETFTQPWTCLLYTSPSPRDS